MSMESKGKCQLCPKMSDSRCSWCRGVFYCSKKHQVEDWGNHKLICSKKKYRMEKNEKLGRFLVAAEEIKGDQMLFKDKPIVFGPKVGLLDSEDGFCFGCLQELTEDEELSCEECLLPICSSICSSQYYHKNFECRILAEAGGKEPNEELLDKLKSNLLYFRSLLLKILYPKIWAELKDLDGNLDKREDIPNLEQTARIFAELKSLLLLINHEVLEFTKPDLHFLLGVLDTNSIDVRVSENQEVTMLFPTFSLLEHSCCPSAKFYFQPHKKYLQEVFVRTAVKLKPDDHISIMYTNVLWNTPKRKEHLKKTKFFNCTCQRCQDPSELSSNFSTILCPLPTCKAYSYPVPKTNQKGTPSLTSPVEDEIMWKCSSQKCGKICEAWQVKKVDSKLCDMVAKIPQNAKNYREMVKKMEELVHPDYYLNFVAIHSLIQMYVQDEEMKRNKEMLEEKLTYCNRLLGSIKKLDPGLAKMNIYAAVIYYEMHTAILTLVGGEEDDDFKVLRKNPETVKLGRVYLQKCIDCFQYEFMNLPENKLKILATKKLEYLNMIMNNR